MKKVLFANSSNPICGVYQFGKSIYNALSGNIDYDVFHCEFANAAEVVNHLKTNKYDIVIFNWHYSTMFWLRDFLILYIKDKGIKTGIIPHNSNYPADLSLFDVIVYDNPMLNFKPPKIFGLPRIPKKIAQNPKYEKNTIGFSGFLFPHKNFGGLVNQVVKEYSENVTINVHSVPYQDDYRPFKQFDLYEKAYRNIKIEHNSNFLSDEEIVLWMSKNEINIFPYEISSNISDNQGFSSIADYAIASNRPFAVSKSSLFKHIWDEEPRVVFEENTIKSIIELGDKPCKKFQKIWNKEVYLERWNSILEFLAT